MNKAIVVLMALVFSLSASFANSENLFVKYGKKYDVPAELLWAIAKTESNFNPKAINKNKNGTYDIGLMQINTVHKDYLKSVGIELRHLFIPEVSIDVGAKILSNCLKKYGYNYKGLNCYNGRTERNSYNRRVIKNLKVAMRKAQKSKQKEVL